MIDREQADKLLKSHIKNEHLLFHSYASEAVMRALAKKLNKDENKWALAGLLHDIDMEIINADPKKHGLVACEILKDIDVDADIINAIKMHNQEATGEKRTTVFQHALAAGETITGMITAATLVYPDKKIKSLKPKSVIKRMKEKKFAASVNRETIKECEEIGIPLNDFVDICVDAMKKIGEKIGL